MSEKQWTPFYLDLDFWKCYLTCLNWTYCWSKLTADLNPLRKMAFRERLHPKGIPFSGFKCMRGLGFHLLKIWKSRKTVISVGKKAQKALQMHYSGCEKSWVNGFVLWFIHVLKTVYVQQLKGMQSSKLGMWKGYRCQEKVYEGVLDCEQSLIFLCKVTTRKT